MWTLISRVWFCTNQNSNRRLETWRARYSVKVCKGNVFICTRLKATLIQRIWCKNQLNLAFIAVFHDILTIPRYQNEGFITTTKSNYVDMTMFMVLNCVNRRRKYLRFCVRRQMNGSHLLSLHNNRTVHSFLYSHIHKEARVSTKCSFQNSISSMNLNIKSINVVLEELKNPTVISKCRHRH